MPRNLGLEDLVRDTLGDPAGLSGKAMFGGWAFLLDGKLLCGVGKKGLMLRVGPDNEPWALEMPGVSPVMMRGRRMRGYVRADPEASEDGRKRKRLLDAALAFTRSLPRK
ncbi:MAG TPA: TfoX/Sxy family protein [Terriglobales bacterium]|nr:TfoX/Sxy family protein [Terriglobales bacterium]